MESNSDLSNVFHVLNSPTGIILKKEKLFKLIQHKICQVDCKYIVKDCDNISVGILNNSEMLSQSRIIEKKNNKRLQVKDSRIRLLKKNHQNTTDSDF